MKTRLNVPKFAMLIFGWFIFMTVTGIVPGFWGSILMGLPLSLIATESYYEEDEEE